MARSKEFDPDEALAHARERFHGHGYAQSSMQALLSDMSIGQGSFYGTFGSKEALFRKALETYASEVIGRMTKMLEDPDPVAGIGTLLERTAQHFAGDPAHRGCFLVNTVVERAPHDPDVADLLRHHWDRLENALAKTLARAKAEGRLSCEIAPRALARMLLAVIHGIAVRSKFDPRPGPLLEIARAATAAIR